VVVAVVMGGCYHGSAHDASPVALRRQPGWVMIDGLPSIRQSSDSDCGAAALAMVLQRWGVPASPADILRAYPATPGQGIAAGDLRDFARARGLGAFLIQGEIRDLATEVGLQHPVLVGLVQRHGDRLSSHYEVVAGINVGARRLFLLDPARGPREDSYDGFRAEWEPTGRVTLVVVTAGNRTP
jgi:ABC-type bacteriocin/lantibiotic exporter with double-glycine peptidase domain